MNATCEAAAITLRQWSDVAQPGEQRIYFTGFLACSSAMSGLARAARELQESGAVHLVQKRIGPEVYAYIAQRRRNTGETSAV
jgi:hypothetical protein